MNISSSLREMNRSFKNEETFFITCSFIHLIDYMQTNTMHVLLLNTYRELIQLLKIYTEFLPDDESIDNDVIDLPLKENRQSSHRIQV